MPHAPDHADDHAGAEGAAGLLQARQGEAAPASLLGDSAPEQSCPQKGGQKTKPVAPVDLWIEVRVADVELCSQIFDHQLTEEEGQVPTQADAPKFPTRK